MIAYNSNSSEFFGIIKSDLMRFADPPESDKLLRTIASTLTSSMSIRVHQEGKAADGTQIGTYSPSYMKVRTGQFKNADVYKRGAKAGKNKNAGITTKGLSKGEKRKRYNRSSDTKVILSLTRQMENDLSVCEQNPIKTSYGYAIGYQNEFNMVKLEENEKRYGKPILTKLSKDEENLIDLIVEDALRNN